MLRDHCRLLYFVGDLYSWKKGNISMSLLVKLWPILGMLPYVWCCHVAVLEFEGAIVSASMGAKKMTGHQDCQCFTYS